MPIADMEARREAIDPTRSFIVQAPAGSGKTELLIQRFLKLLGQVDQPEQILAMTFTRKAAGEMKERIVKALTAAAASPEPPDMEHERTTWSLARRVLERDHEHNWRLLDHSSRLQIQTMDSFCSGLTRQIPLLSQIGGSLGIQQNAESLYRETAHRVLSRVEDDAPISTCIRTLLEHLDNSKSGFIMRLLQLLGKRDQWMIYFFEAGQIQLRDQLSDDSRKRQGEILSGLIASMIEGVRDLLLFEEARIATLMAYAAGHVDEAGPHADLTLMQGCQGLPPADAGHLPHWKALAGWLTTKSGGIRKSPNKNQGFPSGPAGTEKRAMLDEFRDLLESLRGVATLPENLEDVTQAPNPFFSDEEWNVLKATLYTLPFMAETLREVFLEKGATDFSEISLSALKALGTEEAPTDLLLSLDHQIQHILVDEYQDTSYKQYELLKRLTSGWERGDGRTLYIVGDPMQSIYRFRDAEVSLYLETREKSLNNIQLHPLLLKTNFRSQKKVVDWVNACFGGLFPAHDNPETGAISYSPSEACWPEEAFPGAVYHPLPPSESAQEYAEAEALKVTNLVLRLQKEHPGASIALLVRARNHLSSIVTHFRQRGIRFQAEDIDPLTSRPEIRDLLALMRALINPADRLSWLSVLRAPWCGLSLNDVHRLAWNDREAPVWDLLNHPQGLNGMSDDGRRRARKFIEIMTPVMVALPSARFREILEACWIALAGPACVDSATPEDIQVFFDEVEKVVDTGDRVQLENFHLVLGQLYASPQTGEGHPVQIMTLHKAKGLEFDFVLLPGLGKMTPNESKRLVFWMPYQEDLLLAPIEERGGPNSQVYDFLARLDKEKDRFEVLRLLYVATTRAKKRIHLFGHVKQNKDGCEPSKSSLLGRLWPFLGEEWAGRLETMDTPDPPASEAADPAPMPHIIRRLPENYAHPPFCEEIEVAQAPVLVGDDIAPPMFDWAGYGARCLGNVLHRAFRDIAEEGLERWTMERVEGMRPRLFLALLAEGLPAKEAEKKLPDALTALGNILKDPAGRWLLGAKDGAAELPLTAHIDRRYQNKIIDRTFIDEKGVRWIIDYKTGTTRGNREHFLAEEKERYRPQLERYAEILRLSGETRPIKTALYYPMLKRLVEL